MFYELFRIIVKIKQEHGYVLLWFYSSSMFLCVYFIIRLDMTKIVDKDVKPQYKQKKIFYWHLEGTMPLSRFKYVNPRVYFFLQTKRLHSIKSRQILIWLCWYHCSATGICDDYDYCDLLVQKQKFEHNSDQLRSVLFLFAAK